MSNIPKKPRFKMAVECAQNVLRYADIHAYPIDLQDLYSKTIVTIHPYSYYAKMFGWSVAEYCNLTGFHDGFTIYDATSKKYIVAYNDLIANEARIRWTLAHELGHIALNHFVDFDATRYSLGGMADDEYNVLDVEANTFADELLCPPAMVGLIPEPVRCVKTISSLFQVSKQAAEKTLTSWVKYSEIHSKRMYFYECQFSGYLDDLMQSYLEYTMNHTGVS